MHFFIIYLSKNTLAFKKKMFYNTCSKNETHDLKDVGNTSFLDFKILKGN